MFPVFRHPKEGAGGRHSLAIFSHRLLLPVLFHFPFVDDVAVGKIPTRWVVCTHTGNNNIYRIIDVISLINFLFITTFAIYQDRRRNVLSACTSSDHVFVTPFFSFERSITLLFISFIIYNVQLLSDLMIRFFCVPCILVNRVRCFYKYITCHVYAWCDRDGRSYYGVVPPITANIAMSMKHLSSTSI